MKKSLIFLGVFLLVFNLKLYAQDSLDISKRVDSTQTENQTINTQSVNKVESSNSLDSTLQPQIKSETQGTQISSSKTKEEPNLQDTTKTETKETEESATSTVQAPQKEEGKKEEKKSSSEGSNITASATLVTIDGKTWMRLTLIPEIPIWKFAVAFDLDLYIDDSGNINTKGWDFSSTDNVFKTLLTKIYYVRFGHPGEPLYFRVGAIDNYTLGYGIAMAGYNNVQLYPSVKKIGIVTEINNITDYKFSMQIFLNDFYALKNKYPIWAFRGGFAPLGFLKLPIVSSIKLSGFIVKDENVYKGLLDSDGDGVPDYFDDMPYDPNWAITPVKFDDFFYTLNNVLKEEGKDTLTEEEIEKANIITNTEKIKSFNSLEDEFAIVGGDVALNLINNKLVRLDLYGQYAKNYDNDNLPNTQVEGWGIGAPGILAKFLIFQAQVEYRHLENRFITNYFDGLYEINRAQVMYDPIKDTSIIILKQYTLDSAIYNGIYGSLGASILNMIYLYGNYEYMIDDKDNTNQRVYLKGYVDKKLLSMIPKLSVLEVFYAKSNIDITEEKFWEPTIYTQYGYNIGISLVPNTTFIYKVLYYYVQTGLTKTDVEKKKQLSIGIQTTF